MQAIKLRTLWERNISFSFANMVADERSLFAYEASSPSVATSCISCVVDDAERMQCCRLNGCV